MVHTGKRRAAFLLKGPCGYSNIPKSPQMITSTGAYRKKHAAFIRKGPCGHSNIPKSPQMIASIGVYRKTARGLWLPQPAGAGSPLREGAIVCKGKKSGDVRRIRSTSTRPCIQPKPKRHSRPKCAPAAKPPQQHPAGQTHPRETHAKHPAKTQGHSQPKRVPAA